MENKRRKLPSGAGILAAVVLTFLTAILLINFGLFSRPLARFAEGKTDFPQFIQEAQAACTGGTREKTAFVNINGLFSRLLGQRLCNNVIRLNNGMLTFPSYHQDISPTANNLAEFNQFLSERDIPFLYVQAPCKVDLEEEVLPNGIEYPSNDNADRLLRQLEDSGIHTCDLRPALSATAEQVKQNFYYTDHHWTATAALSAFPMIVEQMNRLLPEQSIDMACTAPDMWEAHTFRSWFLGSQGKRVGRFYGGVDDMTYHTPKFDTEMSCAVPMNHCWFFQGDYSDAVLRMENIEKRDLFNLSSYCVYIGGDYPVVQHRNAAAPNKLKVVMIKDSFTLPMQAYFSTIFQEVHVLDPRHMTTCTVAEYVAMCQPDLVVMLLSADLVGSAGYTRFGSAAAAAWESGLSEPQTIAAHDSVEIAAGNGRYNYTVLADNLEYGKRYTLRIDSAKLLQGSAPGIGTLLYNASSQAAIEYGMMDLQYDPAHGGLSWSFYTPKTGTDQLQLLLYAGIPGETTGIGLRCSGVTVTMEG